MAVEIEELQEHTIIPAVSLDTAAPMATEGASLPSYPIDLAWWQSYRRSPQISIDRHDAQVHQARQDAWAAQYVLQGRRDVPHRISGDRY